MDEIEMDLWPRLILVHHSSCWAKPKRNVVLYDWSHLMNEARYIIKRVMMRSAHSWRLLWYTRNVWQSIGPTQNHNKIQNNSRGPFSPCWRDPECFIYTHITLTAHGGWFTFNRWPPHTSRVEFFFFFVFKFEFHINALHTLNVTCNWRYSKREIKNKNNKQSKKIQKKKLNIRPIRLSSRKPPPFFPTPSPWF